MTNKARKKFLAVCDKYPNETFGRIVTALMAVACEPDGWGCPGEDQIDWLNNVNDIELIETLDDMLEGKHLPIWFPRKS